MNQEIMPSGWSNDYTGSNSFYTSLFNNEFGYREPGPPPTLFPTVLPCLLIGMPCLCRRKGSAIPRCGPSNPFDPEELAHVTCLMDEQLNLIEQYFLENGIGQTDALAIKDEAKNYLEANAYNDDGNNPDLINWFLPYGTIDEIYYALEFLYTEITPPIDGVTSITNKAEYSTLLSQLKLMSDIGDPSNKDSVNKDQFKTIDWNTIIPPGTTPDSYDSASIFNAAETAITNAGGTVPADLADNISRTESNAQSLFNSILTTATPGPSTTPLSSTVSSTDTTSIVSTAVTSTAVTGQVSLTATAQTTTQSTTIETTPSTTQSSPTQTSAVSGSGGANSNGFGNDITNSNGLGSMFGDPHIRIKNPTEPAICFDIEGQSFENSQIIQYTLQECIWISLTF